MTVLNIYKPDGVHKKGAYCQCKNCDKFPEFFHAKIHEKIIGWGTDILEAIRYRNRVYPEGVIMIQVTYQNESYMIKENGDKVFYNKNEGKWYEENGELYSK